MTAMPDTLQHTLQHFTDRILEATKTGQPLRLRGGGTKDFLGQSLQGEVLDTTAYSGILSYEPSELVMTVRGGTPIAEVEAELALRQAGEAEFAPRDQRLECIAARGAHPASSPHHGPADAGAPGRGHRRDRAAGRQAVRRRQDRGLRR